MKKRLKLKCETNEFFGFLRDELTVLRRPITDEFVKKLCYKHEPSIIVGGDLIHKHNGINYTITNFDIIELKFKQGRVVQMLEFDCKGITADDKTNQFVIKLGNFITD